MPFFFSLVRLQYLAFCPFSEQVMNSTRHVNLKICNLFTNNILSNYTNICGVLLSIIIMYSNTMITNNKNMRFFVKNKNMDIHKMKICT